MLMLYAQYLISNAPGKGHINLQKNFHVVLFLVRWLGL